MNVTRTFASEEELREEQRVNLANGGLRVPTTEKLALYAPVEVTLRGPFGAEVTIQATVVAPLPDGVAVAITDNADDLVRRLLNQVERRAPSPAETDGATPQNAWDRMRGLSQMEKILLAVKADRSERALLLQDNDPRVLLSVLRNPRLTVEEVARLAKSPFLNYQIADVIVKTSQWMANVDLRIALVNNPKTPPAFALRILPSLPINDIRNVARGGTSMQLKQAAIKLMQGR